MFNKLGWDPPRYYKLQGGLFICGETLLSNIFNFTPSSGHLKDNTWCIFCDDFKPNLAERR